MYHDFDEGWGGNGKAESNGYPNGVKRSKYCETDQSMMSYSSSKSIWSVCSKENFHAHYINLRKSWCLGGK